MVIPHTRFCCRRAEIMYVTATELKNRLGRYLEAAQVEPVIV